MEFSKSPSFCCIGKIFGNIVERKKMLKGKRGELLPGYCEIDVFLPFISWIPNSGQDFPRV